MLQATTPFSLFSSVLSLYSPSFYETQELVKPCSCVHPLPSPLLTWNKPRMWLLSVRIIWMLSFRFFLKLSPLTCEYPLLWSGVLTFLWLLWTLMTPWWLFVGGPEWSAFLTEGGEPWSSSATSAPGRGGAQGRVSLGREPALGRGSPSSTELQDPSRNRRAHPNWAILGNKTELCFVCVCVCVCVCVFDRAWLFFLSQS